MNVFFFSNNQSLTLNSQVSYVINQRMQNASGSPLKKSSFDGLPSEVNKCCSNIKRYFSSGLSNYSTKPLQCQRFDLSFTSNKKLESFQGHVCEPKVVTKSHGFLTNRWTNHILAETLVTFINTSRKYQHLYCQTRAFKPVRQAKEDKDAGFCNKLRSYFGLYDLNLNSNQHVRKHFESFNNTISKENLTPEQKTNILLAFFEEYILAKDNLANQKSTWKFYHFSIAVVVAGLSFYLFKKSGFSAFFTNSNLSIEVSESNVKFSDVKGADEAKQELKNVVEFLKNPEKFSALGGKLPKGVLLVGPPGTGKTLLAKAVAGEAGVPFFSTSGPEFEEIYVGVGARRIRELFKIAKENIPCVIFIDEIDSIGKERTSSSLHPHANDTINQLLSEMDGFRNSGGIIVLGATNRKRDLDKALLRPGRFDVEVTVAVPDYTGRKELIEFYLGRVRHQNIDVESLARGTTNFTGADIENVINQAALRAAVLGAQHVAMEHLEYARDKALMGPESMSRITDEETNRITAYHEGGHTVVAYYTEHSQPLHKVTIIARGSSLGHTAYIPEKDIYHVTKTQLLAMLDAMMGGRAAEELIFGSENVTSGASSDLEKATELASKMVKQWGMSDALGLSTYNSHSISPQTANLIDIEVKKLLHESYERAKSILITHKDEHKELSEALLKFETLDANEITAIMKGNKDFTSKTKKL